jgi:hypothetical protein
MKEPDARAGSPTPRPLDLVDETSDESFPASDPPGWSLLHAGGPCTQSDDNAGPRTPPGPAHRTARPGGLG